MWLIVLGGCLFGLGGEETDGFALKDDAEDTEIGAAVVDTFGAQSQGPAADTAAADTLTIEVEGTTAHVTHDNCPARCDATLDGLDVGQDDRRVTVEYQWQSTDTASGDCLWTVAYDLQNLEEGTWTLVVHDIEREFTVAR